MYTNIHAILYECMYVSVYVLKSNQNQSSLIGY